MFHKIRNSIFAQALGYSALLAISTSVASADLTQTESFFIGGNVQDAAATGQFSLPSFDTTLGTLESVDVTLTINSCSKIQVYNTSGSPVAFTNASVSDPGSVTGPGGIFVTDLLTSTLASGVAGSGLNTFGTAKNTTTASQSADLSTLSLWENQPNGMINFSYTTGNPTYQGTDLGNNLFFGGVLGGTGKFTVVYNYLAPGELATPEPAGAFLSTIVAGAMMIMLAGRRKLLGT